MTQALTREDFLWLSAALGISMHGPIASLPRLFNQNGYSCSEAYAERRYQHFYQD